MLHSRCKNNKIKYFHGRCVRLIYNEQNFSYEVLLEKDNMSTANILMNLLLRCLKYKMLSSRKWKDVELL